MLPRSPRTPSAGSWISAARPLERRTAAYPQTHPGRERAELADLDVVEKTLDLIFRRTL